MNSHRFDTLTRQVATCRTRRQLFQALIGVTLGDVPARLAGARTGSPVHDSVVQPLSAQPTSKAAADPKFIRPPSPSQYCWNQAEAVQGPSQPPSPFLYQPFALQRTQPTTATDLGDIWTAQVDHTTPTYTQDGKIDTLGETLTYRAHRGSTDPQGSLQGGTEVYLPNGSHVFEDYTVSPRQITTATGSTIFGYESPSIEDYLFYDGHDGHDFAVAGAALAAAAGTVVFADDSGTPFGRVVEISHPQGYLTRYAHLAAFSVTKGQVIDKPGVPIGTIGGSAHVRKKGGPPQGVLVDGYWLTHLHFGVFRWNAAQGAWQITDPFGWDPYQGPGKQGDDPLVRCNGEVSYNLWFGWWPRPYGDTSARISAALPAGGRYLGGSLSDPVLVAPQAPLPACQLGQPCNQAETQGCQDAGCCVCKQTTEGDAACIHVVIGCGTACTRSADCGPDEVCWNLAKVSTNPSCPASPGVCSQRCVVPPAQSTAPPVTDASLQCQPDMSYGSECFGRKAVDESCVCIEAEVSSECKILPCATDEDCLWDGVFRVCVQSTCANNGQKIGRCRMPCRDSTTLPDDFLGTWQGTGTQSAPVEDWPVTITFTGGGIDSIVGSVAYPSLGCASDLSLDGVASVALVTTREHLTAGQGTCLDGGMFRARIASDGSLQFDWSSPGGNSVAAGTLTRAQSNAAPTAPPIASGCGEGTTNCNGTCTDIQTRLSGSSPCTIDGDCCAGEVCVTFTGSDGGQTSACRTACQTTADCAAYHFPVFLACLTSDSGAQFCGTPE